MNASWRRLVVAAVSLLVLSLGLAVYSKLSGRSVPALEPVAAPRGERCEDEAECGRDEPLPRVLIRTVRA